MLFALPQSHNLQERLSFALDVINTQSLILTGFSTLYTAITIIIGLLTITLPLLTYFFGIRPSQKAKKELEEKIKDIQKNLEKEVNSKIDSYLTASWNKKVDELLQYIKDNPNIDIFNSGKLIDIQNFLISSKDREFNELQLSKIYLLLTDYENQLNTAIENALSRILFQLGDNYYSKKYFKYILEKSDKLYTQGDSVVKQAVIFYWSLKQPVHIYKYISDCLDINTSEANNNNTFWKRNLSIFIGCHPDIIEYWMNDKESIDSISIPQINNFVRCLEKVNNDTAKKISKVLPESYLGEKMTVSEKNS